MCNLQVSPGVNANTCKPAVNPARHTSFSAIAVAMATAVSENVDEFLAVSPEELAVRFELVPGAVVSTQ